MFFIYSILYYIVAIALLPFEYLKRPAGVRKRWLREKFGAVELPARAQGRPVIWVHAVSVGEVISATPFLREIGKRYPSSRIILSTITDTGQKVARERVSDIADVVYLPFDIPFIIERLIKRTKPGLFIAIETELWPNIFRVFKKKGIPVAVMNGRLSEKSFKGYKKIRFFMKSVLKNVDMLCMQDETYAGRIKALGADDARVKVAGNFKFDTRPPERLPEWAAVFTGPVLLAGSTHAGEEDLIISVFEKLRRDFPDLNLIIAPRHPERFKQVEDLVKAKGLSYAKRSEMRIVDSQLTTQNSTLKIVIMDTVGELASAYGICDIAVIGGSFVRHGGQNPLEPAFWGKPVVCGPHMENFPFMDDFYKDGAAAETDETRLYDTLRDLLLSPGKRKEMGERAKRLYGEKAGAVRRTMEELDRIMQRDFRHE